MAIELLMLRRTPRRQLPAGLIRWGDFRFPPRAQHVPHCPSSAALLSGFYSAADDASILLITFHQFVAWNVKNRAPRDRQSPDWHLQYGRRRRQLFQANRRLALPGKHHPTSQTKRIHNATLRTVYKYMRFRGHRKIHSANTVLDIRLRSNVLCAPFFFFHN